MVTHSQQLGTLEVSGGTRSVRFGLIVGWLMASLAVLSLLAGLVWSRNVARYPGAERQAATQVQLRFQPTGTLSQYSAYETPDDLPQVLGWYSQHLGLGHDMPDGENCVTMTGVGGDILFLQRSIAVTLCTYRAHTLIFINHSLAVR